MDSFCGEIAYRFAEPIYNLIQGRKYLVSKTSEPYFLPNLFYRVHFRRIWRNEEHANIIWYIQFCRFMPCGTVATQKNPIIRINLGEGTEKHIHAPTITVGHDQKMAFSSQTRVDAAKPITVLLCTVCTHPNEKCTQFPDSVLSCALYQNKRGKPYLRNPNFIPIGDGFGFLLFFSSIVV